MKIIVVGCGKVGYTIAKGLSAKKNADVTVVEIDQGAIDASSEDIDAIFVLGSGLSEKTLVEAGARHAELIVCTAGADESNILCCIMAKKLGTKHTAARVRNPEYALEFSKLLEELGIDMAINPEQQTAREISRLLRYPAAENIELFAGGRIELVSFKVSEAPDYFEGKTVSQIFDKKMGILLVAVERGQRALVPNGDFVFERSDSVKILGRPSNIYKFFTHIKNLQRTREIMIVGGGSIAYYLAELLFRHTEKPKIKIIEKDRGKCEKLQDALAEVARGCLFICGDGTDEELLLAEQIESMDAFVCLTDRDEENAIISLYALQTGVNKVVTKLNHLRENMVKNLGLKSIVTPHSITAAIVDRYVDGLAGITGTSVRTIHRIFSSGNEYVEAVEFNAGKRAKCLGLPIKKLKLKKDILIGCIARGAEIIFPSGDAQLQPDDNVIIIAKNSDIRELDDILASKGETAANPAESGEQDLV